MRKKKNKRNAGRRGFRFRRSSPDRPARDPERNGREERADRNSGGPSQAPRSYVAFISYRHTPFDRAVARKLHGLIERYRVPRALRDRRGKKLGIAFRDQDELPVSDNLSADICKALDHSEYLIVVCTPNTPSSIWVAREIEYFLKNHDRSHVLAVLASGDPDSSFPRALTHLDDEEDTVVEPLAANICAETEAKSLRMLPREAIRLFAAILGCPYDALVRREQKRRQKRLAAVLCIAFAVLIGYAGILLRSNLVIGNKNQELERMNVSLSEQKRSLQLTESSYLTAGAEAALAKNDVYQAISDAVAALPGEGDDRPYYAPAEAALLSALGVFGSGETKVRTVTGTPIQLNSPVRSLCASEDGASLFVLDQDDALSCFHAYSGDLKWKLQLRGLTGSSAWSEDARISPDKVHPWIYVLFGREIFAVEWNSGETLWRTGAGHEYVQCTKNDADDTLICIEQITKESYTNRTFDVVVLDAGTGAERQRCPLGRTFYLGETYRMASGVKDWENNTAFSENGDMFVGAVYDRQNEDTFVHYFAFDPEADEARVFCSEANNEDTVILWMGLRNAGDGQVLTVLKQSGENDRWLKLEKISLTTGEITYEADVKPKTEPAPKYLSKSSAALHWGRDLLLASAGDQLYLLVISTGETLAQTGMHDAVLSLYKAGQYFFGYVLADGTYEIGWVGGYGFSSSARYGASINFGPIAYACPGKGGFIQPVAEKSEVQDFSMGGYRDGCGYVAVVDSADRRTVLVEHYVKIGLQTEDVTLFKDEERLDTIIAQAVDGIPLRIGGDGTILIASRGGNGWFSSCAWKTYDPASGELKEYAYEGDSFNSAWPVLKENKAILLNRDGEVRCYDFARQETEILAAARSAVVIEGTVNGENIQFWAAVTAADAVWIEREDRTVAAQCDGESIRIWSDGQWQQTAEIPETVVWSVPDGTVLDSVFEIGENGYILLSDYGADSGSLAVDSFMLYHCADRTWTRIEDGTHGDSGRKIVLAAEKDLFAVYEQDEMIRIYRISEGTCVTAIRTGISSSSAADIRFICDDRCVAVCSSDGKLEIFDAENGSCVFSGMLGSNLYTCGRLSAHLDAGRKRVYVIEHANHIALCFDASSWTLLGRIENVYGFDGRTDSLYRYSFSTGLTLRVIPTLEEVLQACRETMD